MVLYARSMFKMLCLPDFFISFEYVNKFQWKRLVSVCTKIFQWKSTCSLRTEGRVHRF